MILNKCKLCIRKQGVSYFLIIQLIPQEEQTLLNLILLFKLALNGI